MTAKSSEGVGWFLAWIVIIFLLAVCVFQSGCSTANGVCRDVRSISELGINITQTATDKQRDNSIAFAITEQNRVMKQGIEYQQLLALQKSQ